MGTMISLSRRVSAFRTAAGTFYALFETRHPKFVDNPQPKQTCVAFGTIEHVTRWIFWAMAQCESGLLQSTEGPMDPLDYARYWEHMLRRPDRLFTQPVWLHASDTRRATVPIRSDSVYHGDMRSFASRVLRRHGYDHLALAMEKGEEVLMDLHRDAAVLADLYGGHGGTRMLPSKIIQQPGKGEGDHSLAPKPRQLHRPTQRPRVFHLDHGSRMCAVIPGFGSLIGTRDELMFDFICLAAEMELTAGISGHKAIQLFRLALERDIQPAPANMHVEIDRLAIVEMAFYHDKYQTIANALGRRGQIGQFGMRVTVASLRAVDQLAKVADLPSICLKFVPDSERKALESTDAQPAELLAA